MRCSGRGADIRVVAGYTDIGSARAAEFDAASEPDKEFEADDLTDTVAYVDLVTGGAPCHAFRTLRTNGGSDDGDPAGYLYAGDRDAARRWDLRHLCSLPVGHGEL